MPFDTRVTLNLAANIINNENYEEGYRSSTNRSYYSTYHECCRIAKKYGYNPNSKYYKNFKHKELSDLLINHKSSSQPQEEKNIKKLGRILMQCRDLRSKADYRDDITFSYNQANDTLIQAKRVMSLAKNL